jgi:CheY-like chemotaxis protein
MSRLSVLVADDNAPIRQLLTRILAEHFRVYPPVADGRALVEAALARKPDVVVSDVDMPVLGGIAAMVLLKQLGCRASFVMVSADDAFEGECLDAGAAAFVSKDRMSRELAAIVAAVARTGLLHACEPEPLPAHAQGPEVGSRPNR